MVNIPLSSGIVNAIVFVVIDILGLWAINRGLLALQGYLHYRTASSGSPVVLERSRIPIVSGELLGGSTFFSSLLPLCLAAVVVLAFLATFGINGETQKVYDVPIERNYTTHLSSADRKVLELRDSSIHIFCRETNSSHMTYWPLAFNASSSNPSSRILRPDKSSVMCLQDVQGVSPLLAIRNCQPNWITCLSKDERGEANVRFSWSAPAFDVLYNLSYVPPPSETQFRQVVSEDGDASDPTVALALRADNVGYDQDSIPIIMPGDLMLAKTQRPDEKSGSVCLQAMRLRYHRNSSKTSDVLFGKLFMPMSYINALFANNSAFDYSSFADQTFNFQVSSAEATIEGDVLEKGAAVLLTGLNGLPSGTISSSLLDHANDFISNLLHPEPLTSRIYTASTRDVTSINNLSLVLLVVLLVTGVVLGGIREFLLAIVAGKSEEARRALTAGEYDTLSKMYCAIIERNSDVPLSGFPMQLCVTRTDKRSNCSEQDDSVHSYELSESRA